MSPTLESKRDVLEILQGLEGLEPLKELFWSRLGYDRVNEVLSRRGWTDTAKNALAEDPRLWASGGAGEAFHVIYARLASPDLKRSLERPVVERLLRDHPYALFVFSNDARTHWHFLNVKYDDRVEKRRLFRRIAIGPLECLRTAAERVALLDLETVGQPVQAASSAQAGKPAPLAIQQRHDDAFDVEKVTKQFFREIANWYFWALKRVRFPKDAPKEADGHDHISVIRLITRLIFCWFVKEKGLIPDALFEERELAQTLRGFAPGKNSAKDSVFYRAILQNLFFATLNTEMEKRGWAREEQNFMAHSLYRHKECFHKPGEALGLFKNIPFLNGGLFECLDKDRGEKASPRYVRVDGFSRRPDSRPVVPDFLFFGAERDVDLSADYGAAKYKRVTVRGLIHTLNHYNFTIEENTPLDQEVALDPELSGKVFENLLAAYNPETGATARKQTGSFYTPREIVSYMVDEALLAYLKTKLEQGGTQGDTQGDTGIPVCDSKGDTDIPVCDAQNPQAGMPVAPSTNPLTITQRNLPHWTTEGAIYWITFRLADALPQEKLRAWKEERDIWLKHHPKPWTESVWKEYDQRLGDRLEEWLDAGLGSRALARPDVRKAVKECLLRFDGERLRLHSAVIMPTHVHLLLEPLGDNKLPELLKGIKGAGARQANKILNTSGQFWLDESYDHIVRSEDQYRHFLRYIAENPAKAHLRPNEYWHYEGDTGIPACASSSQSTSTDRNVCATCATLEGRLRHLFAYNEEPHQFTAPEVDILIAAIDNLKALDPAVGSGAFPMGILHKLVFILGKLDPRNEKWKERQVRRVRDAIAAAEKIEEAALRERTVRELEQQIAGVNEAFERNELDYGRKLYLIENCIYGVDIQPIAVQIAKMRFFISLIVDQKVEGETGIPACDKGETGIPACDKGDAGIPACHSETAQTGMSVPPVPPWNRGVRPLPNLETKFVAANTLIGVNRPAQLVLRNPEIERKEAELRRVRERHFNARTLGTKAKYRQQDAKLRAEISEMLKDDGWDDATARKLASWDPYDQNASADFFDPEWMFGITDGFDVCLGNPPYVRQEQIKELKPAFERQYQCYTGVADLYVYFYERSLQLLRDGGVLSFISSNKYFRAGYGKKLRVCLAGQTRLYQVIDFGDAPVFTSIAYPSIVILSRSRRTKEVEKPESNNVRVMTWEPGPPIEEFADQFRARSFLIPQSELKSDGWRLESPVVLRLLEKLRRAGQPLGQYVNGRFYRGILTGLNEAFVVDRATRDRLIAEHKSSAEVLKPFLRGRDVKRWRVELPDLWLVFIPWHFPLHEDASVSGASSKAESEFKKRYQAIYEHLSGFKKELSARNKDETGIRYEWYALQRWGAAYWQEFDEPNIAWGNLAKQPQFAFTPRGHNLSAPATFLVSSSKCLLSILNSGISQYWVSQSAAVRQGGFLEYKPMYVSQIPIPAAPPAERTVLEGLVDRILRAKQANPASDISDLEREIDQRVYALYDLTPDEIKVVEEAAK